MGDSVSFIRQKFNGLTADEISLFIREYEDDERKGVQALVERGRKKIEARRKELIRLEEITKYEKKLYSQGINIIAGVDEVGRGPLAGPVVTAAVILPKGVVIEGVNDSKKLSAKKREALFEVIKEKAVSFAVGLESNAVIDDINILCAALSAMKSAVDGLSVRPEAVLVDAVTIPNIGIKQQAIIKGDEKSISIACASIIAKVTRDRLMEEFDEIYPGYGFKENKGYASAAHINAIKELGLCPIHRRSFTKNFT